MYKEYEHKDHLGNVRLVYSDLKTTPGYPYQPLNFELDLRAVDNYYPFGMLQPDRRWQSSGYRYGFNGKEMDNEIRNNANHDGTATSYDFGARMYDPRVGRWWSLDPMMKKHPEFTHFSFVYDNPINLIDPYGLDSMFYNKKGNEINRIDCDDDFFFLQHKEGNKKISGTNFYQGLSRESFFGDRSNKSDKLFDILDVATMNSDKKIADAVDAHTKPDETWGGFFKESGNLDHYDYKNTLLGPFAENPIDNENTAYLYNGIILNRNEAGNVFWGATSEKLGIPSSIIMVGTQAFSIVTERMLDESAEQTAIFIGRHLYEKVQKKKE